MATDLWQLRRQKRMTIDELARQAGIHPALIKAYELGERSIPERDLEKLAGALEVESWDIKEMSDPPPRGPARQTPPPAPDSDTERPRYDSGGGGYSRFNSDPPRPGYGSDSSRPGLPPDSSRGGYGNESGRSNYNTEGRRTGYGGEGGRSSYGGGERSNYSSGGERSNYSSGGERSGGYSGGGERSGGYGGGERPGYGRSDYNRPSYGDRGPSRYGDDRPPARPGDRQGFKPRTDRPPRKNGGGIKRRPQVAPARLSQIEHLKALLLRLEMSGEDLLRLAGKPLSMLNRKEAAELLTTCQGMLAERKPPKPKGKRQRPYLPESVDEHELAYLTEIQLDKRDLRLTLFNGEAVRGKLQGFSPYALTLSKPDGDEITVQKLAIAYYETAPAPAREPDARGTEEDD